MKEIDAQVAQERLRTRITNELWMQLEKHIAEQFNGRRGSLGLVVERALIEYLERHRNEGKL